MHPEFALTWTGWFLHMNRYAATILLSMIPLAELRGSIPFASQYFHIPLWKAFLIAIAGNMIPIPFVLWLLGPASEWLMKHSKIMDRFFNWLFDRTRRKRQKQYEVYAEVVLAVFVAIPFPMTGAWSGAVAAFIFGIPKKKALFWIFLGVIGAGLAVTAIMAVVGKNSFLWKLLVGG
ncbi:MAG: ligand-binding protein SH3 [Candidatus Anoxymicrobium japonicum]|uniref:Ligand-binding protein SH3 n=1 Tax=Candidatus Anoxymicrobium japonicum TaxID=2013648 RepID=A0A2N3G5S8_9ACTN|nr:MAG: ligand-binding protein SH3 [Candidatus Anoxymicrobium japonicum]